MPDDESADDALTWEGDDALDAPVRPTRRRRTAPQRAVGSDGAGDLPVRFADDDAEPVAGDVDQVSGAGLVLLGVFGGIALLEAIGWVQGDFRLPTFTRLGSGSGPLDVVTYALEIVARVVAVLGAPLWFAVVASKAPSGFSRLVWFVIGALLLLPWPVLVHG